MEETKEHLVNISFPQRLFFGGGGVQQLIPLASLSEDSLEKRPLHTAYTRGGVNSETAQMGVL